MRLSETSPDFGSMFRRLPELLDGETRAGASRAWRLPLEDYDVTGEASPST